MIEHFDQFREKRDAIKIPFIWVTFALSLLLHILVLWQWLPRWRDLVQQAPDVGEAGGRLQVRIAPRTMPTPAPQPEPSSARPAQASPAQQARPPQVAAPSRRLAPVIALNQRAPDAASIPAPAASPAAPVAPAAPAAPAPAGDLAALLEARRRERGETPPPEIEAEDDNARATRIITGNLAAPRAPTFGYDPKNGGGVFEIRRIGLNDAEFVFFGWNKDIKRNSAQLIEVRRGNNSDTRIAVIRKMIEIIREHEQGDFTWQSQRLGRVITLSARRSDNAGLEEFLMQEFFTGLRYSR